MVVMSAISSIKNFGKCIFHKNKRKLLLGQPALSDIIFSPFSVESQNKKDNKMY
jgi:hypothetical protein